MDVKRAYDDFDLESLLTGLECLDLSLAVQSSKDEVDINTIVKRFGLTGQLPRDLSVPRYEDFQSVFDFHSAMNMVAESNEAFMRMPAEVRKRFGNDPQQLIDFASDVANLDEMRKLGLAVPKDMEVVDPKDKVTRPLPLPVPEHEHTK